MKKMLALLLALSLLLTVSAAFAESGERTEYSMDSFTYSMLSGWTFKELNSTTHYFYKSMQDAFEGYISVQVKDTGMTEAQIQTMGEEALLKMLVDALGTQFGGTMDSSMVAAGNVSGMLFSGPCEMYSCDVAGFLCLKGTKLFVLTLLQKEQTPQALADFITAEILPYITVAE